jgi:hypothetical protein
VGRIFIDAGHSSRDPGAIVGGTTEAQEMILLRNLVVRELQNRGFDVLSVPDPLSMSSTIQWINAQGRRGDVALEIRANVYQNPNVQGAAVFYIANNLQRQKDAELLLNALLSRVAQLRSRGAKPDTIQGVGFLTFCRDIVLPSLVMEVGFLTNDLDRFLLQNRRGDFAVGIADGLDTWSRNVSGTEPPPWRGYSQIGIKLNQQEAYRQKGLLANGNAYVEEASIEGINHDIAFSQMCLETNFLAFGDDLQPTQNNFGRIPKVGSSESDTFPSARIGVRAHIQQLKAYAAGSDQIVQKPPVSDRVYYLPSGGIARFVEQLNNRWSANPQYGNNILNLVRRLYKSASLL